MARTSKLCNSEACAGTMQPVTLEFVPADPDMPSDTGHGWRGTCVTCGTVHPPDTEHEIRDAKTWGKKAKAANEGVLSDPLPPEE